MITHTNTSGASREKSEQECDALPSCANTLPPKADSDGVDEDDGDDDETEDDDNDNEVDDGGCDDDDVDEASLFCKAIRALGAWYVQPSGRQPMSTS